MKIRNQPAAIEGKISGPVMRLIVVSQLAPEIWLDSSIRDFQRHARCRFTKDSFIEEIDFDYLEIWVIEEDMW